MPFWGEGDLSRENPPPAMSLTDRQPLPRFGDLNSWVDSLFTGSPGPFLSVFLEVNFPQGWQLNPYNCGCSNLMVLETKVSLKPPPHPPTPTAGSTVQHPHSDPGHSLWAAHTPYHRPQVSRFALTLRLILFPQSAAPPPDLGF